MNRYLAMLALTALIAATRVTPVDGAPVLKPFVRGSWAQLRQAHGGKALVVHFWGITCPPCVRELPQWNGLMRRHPEVDVVFVAADPVPVESPSVVQALTKAQLETADHWMFADEFIERLRYQVNPDWGGELPFSVLVAADGTVRTVLGTVDFPQLERWLGAHPAAARPQERRR